MNTDADNAGLVLTLLLMTVLLVIAVVAVVAFFRLWRRENKGRDRNFFE
jgi:heme/copper-type cytochrome/quinol oxidase subunit 2